MRRKIIFLGLCAVLLWLMATLKNMQSVLTPELFGSAKMVTLTSVLPVFNHSGLIFNQDVGFVFWGSREEDNAHGRMYQIWGGRILDGEQPIPFFLHDTGPRFSGWIDFRGHPRAFCGSDPGYDLPLVCRWRW